MKVYIAAAYAARDLIQEEIVPVLERQDIQVTSRWLQADHAIQPATEGAGNGHDQSYIDQHVRQDFEDIDSADALLLFTGQYMRYRWPHLDDSRLHSGGRHVETGYALARHKSVVVVGSPENVFHRGACITVSSIVGAVVELLEKVCEECGNDTAVVGLRHCSQCLQNTQTPAAGR